MFELMQEHPWLIPVALGLLIPICGIVFGTITHYLQEKNQADLDASLKHAMLERGMSAQEIAMVLQASSKHKCGKKAMHEGEWHAHHD
jgi:hypothetical protein